MTVLGGSACLEATLKPLQIFHQGRVFQPELFALVFLPFQLEDQLLDEFRVIFKVDVGLTNIDLLEGSFKLPHPDRLLELFTLLEADLILEKTNLPEKIRDIDVGIKLHFVVVWLRAMEAFPRVAEAPVLIWIGGPFPLDVLDHHLIHAQQFLHLVQLSILLLKLIGVVVHQLVHPQVDVLLLFQVTTHAQLLNLYAGFLVFQIELVLHVLPSWVLPTLLSLPLPLDIFLRVALSASMSVLLWPESEFRLLAPLVAFLLLSLLPREPCLIVMNDLSKLLNLLPQFFLGSQSLMIRLLPQIRPDVTFPAEGIPGSIRISLKLGGEITGLCQLYFKLLGYGFQLCDLLVLLVDVLVVFVDEFVDLVLVDELCLLNCFPEAIIRILLTVLL